MMSGEDSEADARRLRHPTRPVLASRHQSEPAPAEAIPALPPAFATAKTWPFAHAGDAAASAPRSRFQRTLPVRALIAAALPSFSSVNRSPLASTGWNSIREL